MFGPQRSVVFPHCSTTGLLSHPPLTPSYRSILTRQLRRRREEAQVEIRKQKVGSTTLTIHWPPCHQVLKSTLVTP